MYNLLRFLPEAIYHYLREHIYPPVLRHQVSTSARNDIHHLSSLSDPCSSLMLRLKARLLTAVVNLSSISSQQGIKLSASGVDVGGDILFTERVGFSGTPSDLACRVCALADCMLSRVLHSFCSTALDG